MSSCSGANRRSPRPGGEGRTEASTVSLTPLALVALVVIVLAPACGPASETGSEAGVAEDGAGASETPGDGGAAEAAAPEPDAAPLPPEYEGLLEGGRPRAEVDRDTYSNPLRVYDFLGIREGDVVADLLAGGGYNTYLLARLVGPDGRIYAEQPGDGLRRRLAEGGDMADLDNVEPISDLAALPGAELDAVVAVRAYHLFPDVPAALEELHRAVKPGGVVGIVEVRLNRPRGHDMSSHRMGERTVIEDMEAAGFEFVARSDLLRRDDDDYTIYRAGERHMTDRMLLKFRKPAEDGD